ncbi:hypothetical protein MRF4_22115 [Methylobacterium radiotolerans]|uniref:helix-turn-helix domain-containing protein n=1 Tax=Methylobacterium TaxID=407 RepID=UPI002F305061
MIPFPSKHATEAESRLYDEPPTTLEPFAPRTKRAKNALGKFISQSDLSTLDAISSDDRVNPTTFEVAYWIMRHVNHKSRDAWPSQKTLMSLAGVRETTLRKCLKTLIEHGYLVQLKRGKRNGNKYRFCALPEDEAA